MSTTYDSPAAKNLRSRASGQKMTVMLLDGCPLSVFLSLKSWHFFIYPSIENLLCEKHAENVLMEPHVWSDIVYIRLTQFENNAIWQKRQVDEMSVVSFSFFFGIIVEWVEYNHGKAESWPRFLALLLTSCMIQDSRHGFDPTFIIEQTWGERGARVWTGLQHSPFSSD